MPRTRPRQRRLGTGRSGVEGEPFLFNAGTGPNRQKLWLNSGGWLHYRPESGHYLQIRAQDLGLPSHSLRLQGGVQGHYDWFAGYQALSRFSDDSARTLFRGLGSEHLQPPSDWPGGETTQDLPQLTRNSHDLDLDLRRETVRTGFRFLPDARWDYSVNVSQSQRQGTRAHGASFLTSSALLPATIDDTTQEIEAAVHYYHRHWRWQFSYLGSFYDNEQDRLRWDHPFTPLVAGADQGQIATAPDNRFNQLRLSGSYLGSDTLSGSASVAVGRMRQDDNFLPATVNATLVPVPLPRGDLNARVDTLNARAQLHATLSPELRLNSRIGHDERDNRTQVDAYPQVATDLFLAQARRNRPYSFKRSSAALDADYRLTGDTDLAGGIDTERYQRSLQEVEKTLTHGVWAQVQTRLGEPLSFKTRYRREKRDQQGDYEPLPLLPDENPLLRKFNLTDRSRDRWQLNLSYTPSARLKLDTRVEYARDTYPNTELGLTRSRDWQWGLDASYAWTPALNSYLYWHQQVIDSDLSGSNNAGSPNWQAEQRDELQSVGGGIEAASLLDNLDVGFNLAYSQGRGDITVDDQLASPPFPDLVTERHSAELYGDFQLDDRSSLRATYWYERYREADFYRDGLQPDTLDKVLTLGRDSLNGDVHAFALQWRFRF